MSEYVNKIINCQSKYMGLVGESDWASKYVALDKKV